MAEDSEGCVETLGEVASKLADVITERDAALARVARLEVLIRRFGSDS